MLTAIRNICSTISDHDEHRLGHEESMEPKTLLMSDQFCRGCHQPHSLDENKRCEFCRREPAEPRPSLLGRIWKTLTRQQDISILKSN